MSASAYDPEKIGDPEDVRQSGTTSVAISNYVATAALGVLAGAVVLFTYVSGTFAVGSLFYWLIGAGVLILVASIFLGGRGSDAVAKAIGRKEYNPNKNSELYNWQAILTLIGLLLVVASAVAGVTVSRLHSDLDARIGTLEKEVAILRTETSRKTARSTDDNRFGPPDCGRHGPWRKHTARWPRERHRHC
jgi:hypothetical protein